MNRDRRDYMFQLGKYVLHKSSFTQANGSVYIFGKKKASSAQLIIHILIFFPSSFPELHMLPFFVYAKYKCSSSSWIIENFIQIFFPDV